MDLIRDPLPTSPSAYWLAETSTPVYDHALCAMTYRTGFLRIEAETAESAMETDGHHQALSGADRLLAAIVASSDDAIISKTVDGIVTSWNRGAERIFGYSAKEMIGNPISILAVPGHEDEMPDILYRIRRNERVDHFETTRRHRNGSI